MCSRSAFLESEKARVLSKGLGFLEGSTKCHCDIVTALSHITNLFHSNLLFTGETKIWAFLPLRSPATCCQENSFLVLLGLLSRLHFLGKSAKRYQSRQEHPGTLICLEFNQMSPRHGIIYPTPGSAHFKNISEIKIQIIRTLLFTMSFLGFMYLDTHVALPKKLAQAFPWFWPVSSESGNKTAGFQSCFSVILLSLVSWSLLSCTRGLEKLLKAVSGGMVLMPGMNKLIVPTLWLWRLVMSSHRSESQGPQ